MEQQMFYQDLLNALKSIAIGLSQIHETMTDIKDVMVNTGNEISNIECHLRDK